MIKLINATIHRYKSIETEQAFDVEQGITVLVGMNESGKTSILESMAKVSYFDSTDGSFKYNLTHDYPRKQKKAVDKSGETPKSVTLTYEISDDLKETIETDIGIKLKQTTFSYTKKYDNTGSVGSIPISVKEFITAKFKELKINDTEIMNKMLVVKNQKMFEDLFSSNIEEVDAEESDTEEADIVKQFKPLKKYFGANCTWDNPIENYVWRIYLYPNMPKFMYYDDYYMLPSQIDLEEIGKKRSLKNNEKTAKALLELSDIDIDKITDPDEFEDIIAELEATQATISEELFKYWSTNSNLKILFKIESVEESIEEDVPVIQQNRHTGTTTVVNRNIVKHILNIRVQNQRSGVSLPLTNRSKGFNWFFSFLVWFQKIQENTDSTYILLLDEPGLNLHAKAQNDLLNFLSDLSDKYQIIYTTHSPFMIESDKLNQVRTVVEKDDGTHISESVQEKDPNTLFPLQAAIGYNLAQNLFVSDKNLIVEGIADLVYLSLISEALKNSGREGLKSDITIVPVGGADKVATFVSLLRGNELNMVCLLDTFTDQSAKQRLDDMVAQKIIKSKKIIFYHDILNIKHADVEDLFSKDDYLCLYNGAFKTDVKSNDLDDKKPILIALTKLKGKFNHYSPANYLAQNIVKITISSTTLDNFENLFKKINKLL